MPIVCPKCDGEGGYRDHVPYADWERCDLCYGRKTVRALPEVESLQQHVALGHCCDTWRTGGYCQCRMYAQRVSDYLKERDKPQVRVDWSDGKPSRQVAHILKAEQNQERSERR